jgi:CRISPR type III-B/RAMP module-associated protein Cmr3
MTSVYRVRLDPVDPLLFGDNRPARAGFDAVQRDQDASPLMVHGALGTSVLQALGGTLSNWSRAQLTLGPRQSNILVAPVSEVAQLAGLSLHAHTPGAELLFPKPSHFRVKRNVHEGRLWPLELLAPSNANDEAMMTSSCQLKRVLRVGVQPEPGYEEEHGPLWVTAHVLERVLRGERPSDDHVAMAMYRPEEIHRPEPRPGIAIHNEHGTVASGIFFTRPYRRFAPPDPSTLRGAGLTAWFRTLADLPEAMLSSPCEGFLGGDRGRVRIEWRREEDEVPLAKLRNSVHGVDLAATQGFLAYLWTPMILSDGLRLEVGGQPAIAGAVGRARYASGWDAGANAPRPLVTLAPEGSVYFFKWPEDSNDRSRREMLGKYWATALNPVGAAAGFGRILTGVWRCR